MKNEYLMQGVVHPERAPISLKRSFGIKHFTSETDAIAHISVLLNQIAIWIETDIDWDVYDLRNVAKTLVLNELEIIGYLKGYAYDVEIVRVLNRELDIDRVYGIDIPCLANRTADSDLQQRADEIRKKCLGAEGMLIQRCIADLSSAMKHADDTGFYCYRAVESLRQHCILKFGLDPNPKKKEGHWAKIRELTGCSEPLLREIKAAGDAVRHGEVVKITSADRARLFTITWDLVDAYLKSV